MASRQKRIVSISPELPYCRVDTGGGQTLFHHYRILARHCSSLEAFAVDREHNVIAVGYERDISSDSYHAVLIGKPSWRQTFFGKVAARIFRFIFPTFPDLGEITSFVSSSKLRRSLRNADLVELQMFEYFIFARLARIINSNAEIVGVVHDVLSQRWDRRLSHWPTSLRLMYLRYINFLERRMLSGISNLAVLSPKDAALLRRLTRCDSTISILNPPLALELVAENSDAHEKSGSELEKSASSFGFVSALHRRENNDAALWMLQEIWPRVREECPTAHLYIVGSRPSTDLERAASRFPDSVTVTGYVDNLEPFYQLFDTAVIPLRYGAGVKLKTIAAILKGKNIVATPIAVEGTLSNEFFYCISDSPYELASAMIKLVLNPRGGHQITKNALVEADSRYSGEAYEHSLSSIYCR